MEATIYGVTAITTHMQKYFRSENGKPFYTLAIDVTTSDGRPMTLTLFSDDPETLKLQKQSE
ncbi:MAG: hypothetical protein ACYDBH_24430 [Acidobacteriaceae bacterium]